MTLCLIFSQYDWLDNESMLVLSLSHFLCPYWFILQLPHKLLLVEALSQGLLLGKPSQDDSNIGWGIGSLELEGIQGRNDLENLGNNSIA